jgi:hypothetical protein
MPPLIAYPPKKQGGRCKAGSRQASKGSTTCVGRAGYVPKVTVRVLKAQLKAKGIKGTSGFSKAQLQEVLDKVHELQQKRKATAN